MELGALSAVNYRKIHLGQLCKEIRWLEWASAFSEKNKEKEDSILGGE